MKRVIPVFFCFIFTFSLLLLRLYTLATDSTQGSAAHNTVTLEAASARGYILDCNGEPFVNETVRSVAAAVPLPGVAEKLRQVMPEAAFHTAYARLSGGFPVVAEVTKDVHADGLCTVHCPVRYGETLLIPHLAGYCDSAGHGVCGLEKSYDALLSARTCTVTFAVDAKGRALCGETPTVRDEGILTPHGVVLTLDKRMQTVVREEMLRSGYRKGAAVLLDVHTGDIKAMVSVPEYDVTAVGDSLHDPDAPFINRALNAVSVGSVYKMIVAAAALEDGISPAYTYTCTGSTVQNDVTFHCHLRSGHGTLDMREAMYHSCNTWFINMAREIPVEDILDLSWRMGLGSSVTLADGIVGDAGAVPEPEELAADAARANLAFGQGRLTASPLQMAAATAVIANGGIYYEPRLVAALQMTERTALPQSTGSRALTERTAQKVRELLIYTAKQTESLTFKDCGGKTATAQSGVYENGEEILHTWYSGFFPAQAPQYVLTVLCEEGTSGTEDCIPVFERIVRRIDKLF